MIEKFNNWPQEKQRGFIDQSIAEGSSNQSAGQAQKHRPGILIDFAANMAIVFILDPFVAKAFSLSEGIKHYKAICADTLPP